MPWWGWTIAVIYGICAALAFWANMAIGNITFGLTLLRAVLWPLWIAGFIPGEMQSPD